MNRPIAVMLLTVFISGNVFAGPFGLFRRHHAKTACCAPTTCQSSCGAADSGCPNQCEPEREVIRCRVFGFGGSCHYESSWHESDTTADCDELKAKAREEVDDMAGDGCEIQYYYPDCEGNCPSSFAKLPQGTSSACVYKVSYRIRCHCGCIIDRPVCHADLELAKYAAYIIATTFASEQCGCNYCECGYRICRVPESHPDCPRLLTRQEMESALAE